MENVMDGKQLLVKSAIDVIAGKSMKDDKFIFVLLFIIIYNILV